MVALERISRGETIARWFPHDRRIISSVLPSVDALETELEALDPARRQELLHHSWPTPEGRVAVGARGSAFGRINHSDRPTVLHRFEGSVWTTTASVDLDVGEELCFDYNLGSKYDVRDDEAMRRFLSLCDRCGVQKRPSLGMTKPPCRVPPESLSGSKPLPSLMPPCKDGAVDCSVWV